MKIKYFLAVSILALICMLPGCGGGGGGSPASSAKAIASFSFASLNATGTINEAAKTINVGVPVGTDVRALVATFTTSGVSVKVGTATQASGKTANNFTNPVIYTVTAADGTTAAYTVTVLLLSPGLWDVDKWDACMWS